MKPGATTTAPLFTNPLTAGDAPDPWITWRDGWYYFTATLDPEKGLWVWKSRTITGIDRGRKARVWTAPPTGPQSHMIWAPELHFLRGKWYLYYTASDGVDASHRHYVLEAATADPLGPWIDRGRVDPAFEHYAIDGTILEMPDNRLFFAYTTGSLCIAPMSDPCRVSGPGVVIARPTRDWEHGWLEGPEALIGPSGDIFLVYSAGHSAKVDYRLGLLRLEGRDPLNPAAWRKSPAPAFEPYGTVYTTGHGSMTRSPDGREDWLVYHAKDTTTFGFNGRTPRAQPFTWNEDGTPRFGRPVPPGVLMALPSGQKEV